MSEAMIVGAGEAPYTRHPAPEARVEPLLADAGRGALADAGLVSTRVDGIAVSSFTLAPDHAIDLAWKLGIKPRWLHDEPGGGASAINMLRAAVRAVEGGDAETVLLLSGDVFDREHFGALTAQFNRATRELLAPLDFGGPNALFALLTQRHAAKHGLERRDYGRIAVAQRQWAEDNPNAAYRGRLSLADYEMAPIVAEPLCIFDCVPVVAGANALVIAAGRSGDEGVRVRAIEARFNHDDQDSDGLTTGLAELADELWGRAGYGPDDIDLVSVYDDYTVMVLIQLADLGLIAPDDVRAFARQGLGRDKLALNTSGGQLSAGQAGAAGSMHGMVEVVRQLRGKAGARQVQGARVGLVTGYGMVLYRHGGAANAAVLEVSE